MNRLRWIAGVGLLAGCLQVTERPVCAEEVNTVDDSFVFEERTPRSIAEAVTGEWTIDGEYFERDPTGVQLTVMRAGPAEHVARTHDTELTRSFGFGKNILAIDVYCADELRVPIAVDLQTDDGLVEVWAEGAVSVYDSDGVGLDRDGIEGRATGNLSDATFPILDEDPADWDSPEGVVQLLWPYGEGEAPGGFFGWSASRVQGESQVATTQRVVEW